MGTNSTTFNNISKHTQKVHIIIYGNKHGYQWPAFFEHFSSWEGTPPKIRITIVEVPEPGFRPRCRVDLLGQRLADYAKSFNVVPFEYEGIVSKWENVKVVDLKIASDEVVIVNCIIRSESYQMKQLEQTVLEIFSSIPLIRSNHTYLSM
jgi:GRAS domain family